MGSFLSLPGVQVAELAGVTYRQLDHWVRQGYVTPSVNAAVGRGARRLFSAGDVVRVAALGRFGRARLDIGLVGPLVAALAPSVGDELVVAALDPLAVTTVPAAGLRGFLAAAGAVVVYDPAALHARLHPPDRVGEPVPLREVS